MLSLPNLLTLSRIIAVPILVALLWVPGRLAYGLAFVLYALICITDYLDGWLARRWKIVSRLGAFLDPIADKIMVASVLLMLCAVQVIEGVHIIAALIILLREIMVSGLREFLAGTQVSVPVSLLAKWKTTFQMLALGTLIISVAMPGQEWVLWTGLVFLWAAAVLTLVTGWNYLTVGLKHMQ